MNLCGGTEPLWRSKINSFEKTFYWNLEVSLTLVFLKAMACQQPKLPYFGDKQTRSLRPWDSQNWVFRVSFVRSSVRSSVQFEWFFIEKNIGVIRCRLAVRFWNTGFKTFCKKVVEVLLSKQNENMLWPVFGPLFWNFFWKKLKLHIFHLSRFALVPCAVYLVS